MSHVVAIEIETEVLYELACTITPGLKTVPYEKAKGKYFVISHDWFPEFSGALMRISTAKNDIVSITNSRALNLKIIELKN